MVSEGTMKNDAEEVFMKYSVDQKLTYDGLSSYLRTLFTNSDCENDVSQIVNYLISTASSSSSGRDLCLEEFKLVYSEFIERIRKPVSAFVIVDVQNDFISGSLALTNCPAGEDGAEVVPIINNILERCQFNHVFYSYDWHPRNHISFHSNLKTYHKKLMDPSPDKWESVKMFETVKFDGKPPLDQTMWPDHCIQNTDGAKLHKDLKVVDGAISVYKGSNPAIDSYSAFWDNGEVCSTGLLDEVNKRNITDVYVCGLATDICVNFTATHACKHNFRVVLVEDACRGVDEEAIDKTKEKLVKLGALIRSSSDIEDLISAREIPSQLALVAAENFKRKYQRLPSVA